MIYSKINMLKKKNLFPLQYSIFAHNFMLFSLVFLMSHIYIFISAHTHVEMFILNYGCATLNIPNPI